MPPALVGGLLVHYRVLVAIVAVAVLFTLAWQLALRPRAASRPATPAIAGAAANSPAGGRASPGCGTPPVAVPAPDGVTVTLGVSRTVHAGEPVRFDLNVYNRTSRPIRYFRSGQEYDLWVEGPRGRVWLWSDQEAQRAAFEAYLARASLFPGQQHGRTVVWDQSHCVDSKKPLPSGRYVARAAWLALDDSGRKQGWWSNPVEFEIG